MSAYSSLTISNNIVAFNSSGVHRAGMAPALRHNCVHNPDGTDYTGVSAGVGDISVDPRLRAAEQDDVHLLAGSPCIDAGDDTAVMAGWVDLDGEARIQGLHVDIGADEYKPPVPGDFNGDGDVDLDDLVAFQACIRGPAVSLASGCEGKDLDPDGDVDQDDFGIFQRCFSGAGTSADPQCAM